MVLIRFYHFVFSRLEDGQYDRPIRTTSQLRKLLLTAHLHHFAEKQVRKTQAPPRMKILPKKYCKE
jgi:hypothetical protein